MVKALINATIFTGNEKVSGKAVLIRDNIIDSVIDRRSVPDDAERIDCGNDFLAPGLIDLQIAGAGGFLFSEYPTAEALRAITDAIVRTGTTGFLIVLPTNTFEVYREVIRIAGENPNPAFLGLHLEGPYINPVRSGAHFKECIKIPTLDEVKSLLGNADGIVKMLTIAPEICDEEIIRYLNDKGVVLAAGHSNATFKEAILGFERGIRTTTHLFNAMSQVHHRDPGLPGAVFQSENAFASIIADGIHVDFNMVSIAKKLLKERLFLVSDAVEESKQSACMHVRREDRFTLPDGTLSGSILTMMKAVKNCVEKVGIPTDEALRMASTYPAEIMKLHNTGRIAPGFKADLVLFDSDFKTRMVVSNGEIVSV